MIQSLKASSKAQEKLVRQQLGWVRENEIILESAEKDDEGGEKAVGPIKPFSVPEIALPSPGASRMCCYP